MLLAATAVAAATIRAASRPRYGGTLRMEMRQRVLSLDPRRWPTDSISAASAEKLAALVFDRLVTLDDFGHPQPQLANAWQHDPEYKRWQFTLRAAVKFHDGSPLTPQDVATALEPLLGIGRQIIVSGELAVIQSTAPMPFLLEELASGPYFIFRVHAGGSLAGTGPFRLTEWPVESAGQPARGFPAPAQRADGPLTPAVFRANQDFWNGRPFVDSVEVTMGVPPQRQFQDLQIGKSDLAELAPDQVRRATQAGFRTWSSLPVELFAIVFDAGTSWDPRIRQALSLSIDRSAIAHVLLQKVGEPAGGLLPQWLSGYAFLFPAYADMARAQQLRLVTRVAGVPASRPLRLAVESDDDTARLIAERVALNARPAGITIQLNTRGDPDARLVRWRLGPVAAQAALRGIVRLLDPSDESAALLKKTGADDPEQTYAAERAIIESYRVIPLVYLPETIALGPGVRDWIPARWASWRVADVWLDRPAPSLPNSAGSALAGAKP